MSVALRFMPRLVFAFILGVFGGVTASQAAEREKVAAFLQITGFDVAVEAIANSATAAPKMLGLEEADFGVQWTLLTDQVFDRTVMLSMAEDILEATLDDTILAHGAEFYASDLGQRLVEAENAAQRRPNDAESEAESTAMLEEVRATNPERLAYLERMHSAIDVGDASVRAVQEIQIRFLLAAAAADVVRLKVDEAGLRAMLAEQQDELRVQLRQGALASAALTYRDFSNDDMRLYAEALEAQEMRQLYELMNAVQSEIMANRFETLAARMAGLAPGQEL